MISGAIDEQHRTVMGWKKFKRSRLLVIMSKYGRKLYIWRKKETLLHKKLSVTICKTSQIFVTFLLLLDAINEWSQFICLCKKVNNCVHCKQINFNIFHLVCIYIYTFVNYKYNVFLKRKDACLMPLSTFVTFPFRWRERNQNSP